MSLTWSQEKYLQAWQFAAQAHHGQTLTASVLPYIVHLSNVAMEVLAALSAEQVIDPDLALQCALLHDTIEDTDVTYADLQTHFGTAVADGVLALTKDETLPKPQQMPDSLARIRQQPTEVWMVKLADRINNLRRPPDYWSAEKRDTYRREAELIHQQLNPASPLLATRLQYKIDTYHRFRTA